MKNWGFGNWSTKGSINIHLQWLNNIPLPRFTGTICKKFCFFGCFTKIFMVKKPKQGVDRWVTATSYQSVTAYMHFNSKLRPTQKYENWSTPQRTYKNQEKTVEVCWIPGYAGISGNEITDKKCQRSIKTTRRNDSMPLTKPVSVYNWRHIWKMEHRVEWERWQT